MSDPKDKLEEFERKYKDSNWEDAQVFFKSMDWLIEEVRRLRLSNDALGGSCQEQANEIKRLRDMIKANEVEFEKFIDRHEAERKEVLEVLLSTQQLLREKRYRNDGVEFSKLNALVRKLEGDKE